MRLSVGTAVLLIGSTYLYASEGPFFVTYTDQMEEQGNLEIASRAVTGKQLDGNRFLGAALEFEYGVMGWWTTEVYLDGQTTANDSTLFTGYRWENRFRLTRRSHWINPVLYVEFENINGADKSLLEVVGHDGEAELGEDANGIARREKKREIEAKLLLGSHWRGWTFAENIIVEKNIAHEPFEFGYAAGAYHPLANEASPDPCNFCRENIRLGAEAYGGLGDTWETNLRSTSHYVAPVMEWKLANGPSFKVSPSFGIGENSAAFLIRFGVSYEISQFGRWIRGRK
jgi:hypothetical protein